MAAVEAVVESRVRGRGQRRLNLVIGGVVVVAVAAYAASWIWFSLWPPVEAGSVSAAIGEARECDPGDIGLDEGVTCQQLAFQAGAPVGIGFTVRNDAPVGMTIEGVEPIGLEIATMAVLQPQLIDIDYLFGADSGRPFQPVEAAPGTERAIQLVGTFVDCNTARGYYSPGSGMVVDRVRMRVRWLLTATDVEIPLNQALELAAPNGCQ